ASVANKELARPAGRLQSWDLEARKETWSCPPEDEVWAIEATKDGAVVTGGSGGVVRCWEQGKLLWKADLPDSPQIWSFGLPPGGDGAAAAADSVVRLLDAKAGGKVLWTSEPHRSAVWSVAVAPGGKTLACGDAEGAVLLRDWEAGKEPREIGGLDDRHHAP